MRNVNAVLFKSVLTLQVSRKAIIPNRLPRVGRMVLWFFGGTNSEAAPFSAVVVFSCEIGSDDGSQGR